MRPYPYTIKYIQPAFFTSRFLTRRPPPERVMKLTTIPTTYSRPHDAIAERASRRSIRRRRSFKQRRHPNVESHAFDKRLQLFLYRHDETTTQNACQLVHSIFAANTQPTIAPAPPGGRRNNMSYIWPSSIRRRVCLRGRGDGVVVKDPRVRFEVFK